MWIIDHLLDDDEKILWKREDVQNLVPDKNRGKKIKKLHIITLICIGITVLLTIYFWFIENVYLTILIPLFGLQFIFITWGSIYDKFRENEKIYELLSEYHSDTTLRNYPKLEVITNKHLIRFEPDRWEEYPIIYGSKNISDIFEYRNEFCFLNLDKLTEISKNIHPDKEKFDLGLYFDVDREIRGDDAPHHWLNDLTRNDYLTLCDLLSREAPQAEFTYLFKKHKERDII